MATLHLGNNMDALARVPPSFHVAFLDYTDASTDGNTLVGLHLERAIDAWVQSLRGAFYSPQKPVKGEASISKFLQLERALLDAIKAIPARSEAFFWSFMQFQGLCNGRSQVRHGAHARRYQSQRVGAH
jgi:hypothetical protein